MFMPTHSLIIYYQDGVSENVAMLDCSSKEELIDGIKSLQKYHSNSIKEHGGYLRYEYINENNRTIYIVAPDELDD